MKFFTWTGLFVGSTLGGMAPKLWGGSMVSGWGVILSMLGGFAGIWAGYRLWQRL